MSVILFPCALSSFSNILKFLFAPNNLFIIYVSQELFEHSTAQNVKDLNSVTGKKKKIGPNVSLLVDEYQN
jgi:hypothetical protein